MKSYVVVLSIVLLLVRVSNSKNITEDDKKISRINKIETRSLINPKREESSRNKSRNYVGTEFEYKWISQLFSEGERTFDMDDGVNEKCRHDFDLYKLHLKNQSIWAIRMMESSEWPSMGIFAGTLDHLGNWDECLIISSRGVKGQYCLAQAKYTIDDNLLNKTFITSRKPDGKPDDESSAWDAVEWYLGNPVRIDRHKLSWAVCIPASCTNSDVRLSLNKTLYPLFKKHGLNIDVKVEPRFCKTKKQENYSMGSYYVSALFGILFSLVIGSSIYDVAMNDDTKKGKKNSMTIELFKSFSAVTNFKKLNHFTPESDYILIHFAKILNIIFVIYGHRFIYFIGYPRFSSEGIETFYRASSLELIHTNVVDVFFCVSGLLTFHFGFLPMMKGGVIYLIFSVIFRWIRMVPVFGLLILFIVYILPYANDGPLWDYKVLMEVDRCKSSWWANLLVMNNIVKTDQQCLVISWYISTDIQLTIIGSILLLIATRRIKLGIVLTIAAFLFSVATTFGVAFVNKYYGLLRLYMSLLEDPRQSNEFNNFYIATYSRAGPYLMGCFTSLIAKVLKDRQYNFTGKQMLLYGVLSLVIGEGSQYYGCVFYDHTREYNRVESALYAALNRSVFVLPYCVLVAMYFTSGLRWFQTLLERRIFVPLGRLTYCAFLVNTIIQLIHASAQKTIMPTTTRLNLYWWAFSDIGMSYLAGLLLHLLCEAPIINMSKLLQRFLFGLAMKKRSEESIDKTNSASTDDNEKSTQCDNKNYSPDLANCNGFKNGFHNRSFINSEIIPKVSESSKI